MGQSAPTDFLFQRLGFLHEVADGAEALQQFFALRTVAGLKRERFFALHNG